MHDLAYENLYKSYEELLKVLLDVLHFEVYRLLGVYMILFFFGLDKFYSPLMGTRYLKIRF